jgi:hypothetical protein
VVAAARRGAQVLATDFSDEMLAELERKATAADQMFAALTAHHSVAFPNSGYHRLNSTPPTIFSSRSRGLHNAGDSAVSKTNSWNRGAPSNNSFVPACSASVFAA